VLLHCHGIISIDKEKKKKKDKKQGAAAGLKSNGATFARTASASALIAVAPALACTRVHGM